MFNMCAAAKINQTKPNIWKLSQVNMLEINIFVSSTHVYFADIEPNKGHLVLTVSRLLGTDKLVID